MKKTLLQHVFNILFYIAVAFSWYMASVCTFSFFDDYSTLLNFLLYAVLFLSGFFHYISFRYNSARTFSTILIVAFGIISTVFYLSNSTLFTTGKAYETDIFHLFHLAVAIALLLGFHLVACGKFNGEIRIHEFNIKMEDGRYEKVTIKEKIPNKSNQIDVKTITKKLLKLILVLFLVFVLLVISFMILCVVDSERNYKEEVSALPTKIVSQEYFAEFDSSDYIRLDWDSLYIEKDNCYYNNDGEYIVISEPTRMISETGKVERNTYWQLGNNKNFITKLVDEDWGDYTRAYYMHKDCVFPNENNKIIKVTTRHNDEFKFTKKQIDYIKNLIKNFDNDLITKPENEFLKENSFLLDDCDLVFCFEDFDDIRLTCCSVVKDKNGQWYLYNDYYHDEYDKEFIFNDLEKLPQDICDTINESLK